MNNGTFSKEKNNSSTGTVKCFEIIELIKKVFKYVCFQFDSSTSELKCHTHMRIRQWSQSFVIFLARGVPQTHVVLSSF